MITTLLTTWRATAASSPPVRHVSRTAATANAARSSRIHGSSEPWASEKVAAESTAVTAAATTGRRIHVPTASSSHPRNRYSSPAAWNGVSTNAMTSSQTQSCARGAVGAPSRAHVPST